MKVDSITKLLVNKLGEKSVLIGSDLMQKYDHIWRMNEPTKTPLIVLPKTTKDVSEIMKICNKLSQKIVIHGGLTNLVGGTKTSNDTIVISLEKMNKIEEFDEKSKTITVQSGVILEDIINKVSERKLLLPLNFGAKGSAQIGGVVSTNAGGLRVFKYGMTRQMVLGLEAVMPDGTIISSLKKVIKDNSGYDLKQFFIGSEGTLGIITKIILKLVVSPSTRYSAIVGIDEYENVINLLKLLEKDIGKILTGFELIWNSTYKTMINNLETVNPPLSDKFKYYVFIEVLGNETENDKILLQKSIENAINLNLILDGSIAENERELKNLWQIREDVGILDYDSKFAQHFDISIPIPKIGSLVDEIVAKLNGLEYVDKIYPFGHVADGNIHFIVGKNENSIEIIDEINKVVYSPLKKLNGSISAEHGIGLDKKKYLYMTRSDDEIELMRKIKKLFDPKLILNPGRII
tara:strand:- start:22897 stop:24285 length:1389 start_codon:yes stop_codon:yes gene_type:complete